jgi:hypothetical protein
LEEEEDAMISNLVKEQQAFANILWTCGNGGAMAGPRGKNVVLLLLLAGDGRSYW